MKQKTIWVFIAVWVCSTAIIIGVRHYQYEQYKQKLAVQAEKVVARQFVDTFTGVTEIKFTDAETGDDGTGFWTLDYTFNSTWKKKLDKRSRQMGHYTPIYNLAKVKNALKHYNLLDDFSTGYGNSNEIFFDHRGKTKNRVVVLYTNGRKEVLSGRR